MTDPTNDRDLDEYLAGGSEISRRYQSLRHEQPSRALDRAVLIEAGAAGTPSAEVTRLRPRRARWMVPFAAAATVLLSLALFRDAGLNSHAPVYTPEPPFATAPLVEQQAELDKQAKIVATPSLAAAVSTPPPPASMPVVPPAPEPGMALGRAFHNVAKDAALSASETNEAQAVADSKQELRESAIEVPPPPLPALRLSAPAASPVVELVRHAEEGKGFRAKAVSSAEKTPEEESLAAIRLQLDAGNKDQALAALKTFQLKYPDYFRQHPEVAKTFPEFSDLLK